MTTTTNPTNEIFLAAEALETAALALGAGEGRWVQLRELRPLAVGIPRELQDAALLHLALAHQVNLAPRADQHRLTPADREAAVRVGGEWKHQLSL